MVVPCVLTYTGCSCCLPSYLVAALAAMPHRFDYSEWVRAYGRYLDEQLEVYARIQYYQVRDTRLPWSPSLDVPKHFLTVAAEMVAAESKTASVLFGL